MLYNIYLGKIKLGQIIIIILSTSYLMCLLCQFDDTPI